MSKTVTMIISSLAFEELASNVVLYGFPLSSSAQPILDVRVVISENTLVIRMRDNCPRYDVTKQIAAVNDEDCDPLHNIGTRVLSKIAFDIKYLNTFDTNNLIVRFELKNEDVSR